MNRAPLFLLYLNVLAVATCGLIYELLAGTLASYLLGDSVTQFSLVIGIYLSALGVGAWLSKFVERKLARCFIEVELGVALLGGTSAPFLFLAFGAIEWFQVLLYGLVFLIGTLVGLELPLLMRILKDHVDFNDLVSRVLTFDYIGALLASIMFPTLLVPQLGLLRTSLIFGILNALVGLWGTFLLRPLLTDRELGGLRGRAVLVIGLLAAAVIKADDLTTYAEESQLSSAIIHAESSPYQRILITKNETGFQLFLNGHLQFNSFDEYRYHEALVHPAMSAPTPRRNILVLGGGDGLAVREILRYPEVEHITLVDLDPQMTSLAKRFPPLAELSEHSLDDPRVTVINQDAFIWIDQQSDQFDTVIVDFPDPGTFSVGKLYSTFFYRKLQQRLTDDARIAIQCTSPLVAPQSYWCILRTLEAAGFHVQPYQAAVPTFGIWGYAFATRAPVDPPTEMDAQIASQCRFLNSQIMQGLFESPADIQPVEAEVNQLNNQILVQYYEREWSRWE
ncbi:polyamine aminopropyltransferase [Rubinisphaera margarita]|uniref:polyamine aminopropyltransferase n=1 Tax=Rubinisphaera margarita TaxID=2909586 RepID=UPI001EE93550|nr:polyamine aminopropyltransferase [Rubinisphaera margarita]MCG6158292.1 polyamine aminopropyltransferase [Rubinisphaera margarita]